MLESFTTMNKLIPLLFSVLLLFGSISGEVAQDLRDFLPCGAELSEEIVFSRNFQLHQLHWQLCREAEAAYQMGGDRLENLKDLIHRWDGFPYRMNDELEKITSDGFLDLSREICLLDGSEEQLKLSVEKLDTRRSWSISQAVAITDLLSRGFCDEWKISLDTYLEGWLSSPVIFLVYDEGQNHELVGTVFANPNTDILIEHPDGEKTLETVWSLQNFCCLPHLAGLGIGSTLMKALAEDPEIQYSCLQVAPDNPGALHLYYKNAFRPTSYPNVNLGLSRDKPYRDFHTMLSSQHPYKIAS